MNRREFERQYGINVCGCGSDLHYGDSSHIAGIGTLCVECERKAAEYRVYAKREKRKEIQRILNTLSVQDRALFDALVNWEVK